MARKIRIEYAGATYHVMARGNQGRDIYADDRDRKLWLETLAEACAMAGWRIHSWVMMDNHYHLLLETPEPNLVAGMKWFQGTRVTQAIRRVKAGADPTLERLRKNQNSGTLLFCMVLDCRATIILFSTLEAGYNRLTYEPKTIHSKYQLYRICRMAQFRWLGCGFRVPHRAHSGSEAEIQEPGR